MAETKDQIAAQRDALRDQVAKLEGDLEHARGQLAAAGASPARVTFPARPAFGLSEGERQALELEGVTNSPFDGKRIYADEHGVDVVTEAGRRRLAEARRDTPRREGIEGVDYVYPSVAPGVLASDAPVRGAVPADQVDDDLVDE